MQSNNTIRFLDATAELLSFGFHDTYEGNMEGSWESVSRHILECEYLERQDGHLLLFDNKPIDWCKIAQMEKFGEPFCWRNPHDGIRLPDYTFNLSVQTDHEHHLSMKWYGDAPDLSIPLHDIIEPVTRNIEFYTHCRFIDIDNL